MGVVVGVALELEQIKIAQQRVGVPTVQRVHALVPPRRDLPPHHPVVFDVVDQFEQRKRPDALRHKKQRHPPKRGFQARCGVHARR